MTSQNTQYDFDLCEVQVYSEPILTDVSIGIFS